MYFENVFVITIYFYECNLEIATKRTKVFGFVALDHGNDWRFSCAESTVWVGLQEGWWNRIYMWQGLVCDLLSSCSALSWQYSWGGELEHTWTWSNCVLYYHTQHFYCTILNHIANCCVPYKQIWTDNCQSVLLNGGHCVLLCSWNCAQ